MKHINLIVISLAVVTFIFLGFFSVPMVISAGGANTCPSGTYWGSRCDPEINLGLVGITLGVDLIIVIEPAILLLVIIAIQREREQPGARSTSAFGLTAAWANSSSFLPPSRPAA